MSNERPDFIPGRFGASIRTRSDFWYTERLIEFLVVGEPGPRGGRPKTTQVLMTPEQARRVLDDLTTALAPTTDPRATAREDGGES